MDALSQAARARLLALARAAIEHTVLSGDAPEQLPDPQGVPEELRAPRGAFVTIQRVDAGLPGYLSLRGCIGSCRSIAT
jgi:AMMECR1 domain-containing protein